MVLEVGVGRVGGGFGGMIGYPPVVSHKSAALDFVAELRGSPRACDRRPAEQNDSFVYADELPVPMFGVDFNMRCTFWNRRAADATGWTESEVVSMPNFAASLFSNQVSEKDCEDILKAALEGQDSAQETWSLKTKWGKNVTALLMANARTDYMGAISGVVCVIMPVSASPNHEQPALKLDCNVSAMDQMSILDLEEEQVNSYDSPREDPFLAALEQPPSPYFGEVRDAIDMYGDPANIAYEADNTSISSQDWCKSEQSSGSGNDLGRSSLTQARAMVIDSNARGRKSLTLVLERCGFEVSCASSEREALYVFEQSTQDPEGFSVVFVNLDAARADDHALIRQLRNVESSCSSPNITTRVAVVGVTDLDRWLDSSQKDVAAGMDEIMNYPLRVQQMCDTLNLLGVQIDHIDFANKSPRTSFSSWTSSLIRAR